MRQVEKIGRTVEEAINYALQELNVDRDKVDIEVLEEVNKSLFNIFGSKECKVRVTVKNEAIERAEKFLKDIFDAMNLKVEIECMELADSLEITLKGDKMGILIGRRGEHLDALQYLVSIVVNKGENEFIRVVLDSENYRQKRKETLTRLANKLAAKVARDKKNVTLEPMNPYERRIIHSVLQNNKYVETISIGEEPNRRVIISYKK